MKLSTKDLELDRFSVMIQVTFERHENWYLEC